MESADVYNNLRALILLSHEAAFNRCLVKTCLSRQHLVLELILFYA